MKVTASLNTSPTGRPEDIQSLLLSAAADLKIVRVFNRGRYAEIEVSPRQLHLLEEVLGDKCTLEQAVAAAAFNSLAHG